MGIDRRGLLIGGITAAAAGPLVAVPDATAQVAALWTEYSSAPYRHAQIPHVSFAGYRYGAARPAPAVRANVLDYGAKPDGSANAAPAINRAIEDVGKAGGGAVLVPAGTFRVDDVIRVGYDNVVLRGAGRSATTLFMTRSLEQIIGINRSRHSSNSNSAWSWSGGLVWVCHRDRYRALTDAIRAQQWPMERWAGNEGGQTRQLTTVTITARRGDFSLTVGSATGLTVGQRVMLQLSDDSGHSLLRHIAGDVSGASSYDWASRDKLLFWLPVLWPVRIAAISGNRVTLDQPLPLDARTAWRPMLVVPLVPPVVGSGVEKLTIRMTPTPAPSHLQDKGYNGIAFQCAWDCWADDVAVVDSDNGILLVSAKGVTISRTSVTGRGRHHSYACREQSHDNLFTDFQVGAPTSSGGSHHGINVEALSCGNVWSKGNMAAGTFDTHRGMPFNNVRTEIVINNNSSHGGDSSSGPLYGARFTHWNVTVTNGRAGGVKIDTVAPRSATVGISTVRDFGQIDKPDFSGSLGSRLESYGNPAVSPPNLYLAQRQLRLGN